MLDQYKRQITYLRISVTDRCNLRCIYCMPKDGIKHISHDDVISYEKIYEFVKIAAKMGITKVRLTGGEPLVRRGIVNLVEMLSSIPQITDLSMTTNGVLLQEFALPLKNAGLQRINISLDTTNKERFKILTRGGNVDQVLQGIEAAKKAKLNPIKINCVIKNNLQEPDARLVTDFAKFHDFEIRYIREMDMEKGTFWPVQGGDGGNCIKCNRLRLTSNGIIRPCLFSNLGIDVKKEGIKKALELAIKNKPQTGLKCSNAHFHSIGG